MSELRGIVVLEYVETSNGRVDLTETTQMNAYPILETYIAFINGHVRMMEQKNGTVKFEGKDGEFKLSIN